MKGLFSLLLLLGGVARAEGVADSFALIRQNDLAALGERLKDEAARSAADAQGNTLLHYAALYGSPEAVALLLHAGASPNARNGEGVTPLIYGATNPAKTTLMLAQGGDVKAASLGNAERLHLLLKRGSDINAVTKVRIGHLPQVEAPVRVNRLAREFFGN